MIVEYGRKHDDNWFFAWTENGEEHEETYWVTGDFENPPIDEFKKDHPDLAKAEFVEF